MEGFIEGPSMELHEAETRNFYAEAKIVSTIFAKASGGGRKHKFSHKKCTD